MKEYKGRRSIMTTLREATVGSSYVIKKIHGTLSKNTEIYVRKVAPLGDPVQIRVRGYELSLRREDAECVEVEEIEK